MSKSKAAIKRNWEGNFSVSLWREQRKIKRHRSAMIRKQKAVNVLV
jgi:hypothetical protein